MQNNFRISIVPNTSLLHFVVSSLSQGGKPSELKDHTLQYGGMLFALDMIPKQPEQTPISLELEGSICISTAEEANQP